jgi:CheY-like chemotaxis protein
VADTGQGMDAKTLERIFEPFFTTKPTGKGTGLGLAVVHGIIQAHEGFITVESQVGQGTTFCVFFPAQAAGAAVSETTAAELPRGQGQHLLLVDDEPALTMSLRQLLSRLNYQITTSNSPREAMVLFQPDPARFDLVITDLAMPEMNGLALARQLHALRPDLPVLLTSGFTSELTPEDLREAGILEVVPKPVSLPVLGAVVQRALAGQNKLTNPQN